MLSPTVNPFDFILPKHLAHSIPTEERGLARDEVKLLVSKLQTDSIFHAEFRQIDRYLRPGDTLIVNTSATIPAALDILLPTGENGRLHLSNQLDQRQWLGELRQLASGFPKRYFLGAPGAKIPLPGGGRATLLQLHVGKTTEQDHLHLWEIELDLPENWPEYLNRFGKPIRYDDQNYPIQYYQTAFGLEAGSAEMPSAGRAFTHALITRLIVRGVQFAPILLHTGVSSLETGEEPYPEFFRVPAFTAHLVNNALRSGNRVIAVGTTSVRAIESAVNDHGWVEAAEGWTEKYITPESGLQVVSGLLSGFHEPKASHLQMLEALAGPHHLELAYEAAVANDYRWHEFGDLHLML